MKKTVFSCRGRIVFCSSICGRLAFPLYGPYTMSKFAMEGYCDTIRFVNLPKKGTIIYIPLGVNFNASVCMLRLWSLAISERPSPTQTTSRPPWNALSDRHLCTFASSTAKSSCRSACNWPMTISLRLPIPHMWNGSLMCEFWRGKWKWDGQRHVQLFPRLHCIVPTETLRCRH